MFAFALRKIIWHVWTEEEQEEITERYFITPKSHWCLTDPAFPSIALFPICLLGICLYLCMPKDKDQENPSCDRPQRECSW
jgi:hypothetical protein